MNSIKKVFILLFASLSVSVSAQGLPVCPTDDADLVAAYIDDSIQKLTAMQPLKDHVTAEEGFRKYASTLPKPTAESIRVGIRSGGVLGFCTLGDSSETVALAPGDTGSN